MLKNWSTKRPRKPLGCNSWQLRPMLQLRLLFVQKTSFQLHVCRCSKLLILIRLFYCVCRCRWQKARLDTWYTVHSLCQNQALFITQSLKPCQLATSPLALPANCPQQFHCPALWQKHQYLRPISKLWHWTVVDWIRMNMKSCIHN